MTQAAAGPLAGAVDIHTHAAPDALARRQDYLELARMAAEVGMAGVVLKSHHFSTAPNAVMAARQVPGIRVFGGLTLNVPSCGGINADAVRSTLTVGGKVIWMPTISSANHQRFMSRDAGEAHMQALTTSQAVVAVVDAGGRVVPGLDQVFELIAEHDAVLATGHISPDESAAVIARAQEIGVRRIVVTHAEASFVAMPIETRMRLAATGVMLEHCYLNILGGHSHPEGLLADIRAVGVEHCILSTDLGQEFNVPTTEGLLSFHDALAGAGLTEDEWRQVACINPSRLLGLETA